DVANYKARITEWLHNNTDLHPFVQEYAAHSEHSLAVSAFDDFFGTHLLDGFPSSQNINGVDMTSEARQRPAQVVERPAGPSGMPMADMPMDELIDNMYQGDRTTQQRAAVTAQYRTGEMSDTQFANYLQWLYSEAPGGNGRLNMESIQLPSYSTMLRPEVVHAITSEDGAGAHFDIPTLRQYFSIPENGPQFPSWLDGYVQQQLARPDGAQVLPNWLINDIRSRFILSANTTVSPENPSAVNVPPEIRQLIDQDTVNQANRPPDPRGGRKQRAPEATRPDTLGDRINGLNGLIEMDDPALSQRLMQLGAEDGRVMNDVVRKIQTYGSNAEFRELLSLTLPNAHSIY
ncbi:MAG: hypothetical protein ACRD3W_26405, partial [Terriglobales bacterium]